MELLSPEPSMFSGDPALQDPLLIATLIEGGWMDAACIDGQGWGCSPPLPWLEPQVEAWIQGDSDATSEGVLEPASWWWPPESAAADPGAEPRPMIAICVLPEPELWLEPPPCGDPITGLEDGVVSVSDDGSQQPSGEGDQQAWGDGSQGPGGDGTEDAGGKDTATSALSDPSELSDPSDGTVLSESGPELDELMAYSFAGELWFEAESSTTDGVVEGELPLPEPSEAPLAFLFDRSNPLPHWRTLSAPPDPLASSAEELTTAADPLGASLPQPPSGPAAGSPMPLIPVPLSSEASEASLPLPVAPPAPFSPAAHPAAITASAQPLAPAPIQRPEPSAPPEVTLSRSPEPAAQASPPTAAAASMPPLNAAPSPQALEPALLPFLASGFHPDAMTRSQTAGQGPVSVTPLPAAGAPAPEQAAAPRQPFDLLPSLLEGGGGAVDGAAPIQTAFGDDSFALSELLDQLLGQLRRL